MPVLLFFLAVVFISWGIMAWRSGCCLSHHKIVPDPNQSLGTNVETFSLQKQWLRIRKQDIALIDKGKGPAVFLFHGCPFHAYEWHLIIERLAKKYRVIAPDLLGLGDTRVSLDDDYRLPQQVEMIINLLTVLGLERAHFVGHDHGAATLQMLMAYHPHRVSSAVLTNAEAYDQWPGAPERPFVRLIVNPLTSPFIRVALKWRAFQRLAFASAVFDSKTLDDATLSAFVRPHLDSPARWRRLMRFFSWQLDPSHNAETMKALEGLRNFNGPTLVLWGRRDSNFGPAIAERLARDIPGCQDIIWLENSAHLPMLEEPKAYGDAIEDFWNKVAATPTKP